MQTLKIVVLGDSIAEGLGVKGNCYADLLQQRLQNAERRVTLSNLAYTAFQITDSHRLLPEIITLRPDLVIFAHGITEAVVRPRPAALRFVPPRWRRIGWLDPRPYYSRRLSKRFVQQVESAIRWRVKNRLIRIYGGSTLMTAQDFECKLTECLEALAQQTNAQVILLTHSGIDERFYPGSLASLCRFQQCVTRAATVNRVQVCDVSDLLVRWSDFFADHFHPNAKGHAKIAAALYTQVAL